MQKGNRITQIQILDRSYVITGAVDDQYLVRLSAYVDAKMREIDESTRTVDTIKVAVMAALTIADELFQERDQAKRVEAIISDKSTRCSQALDRLIRR